MSKQKLLIFLAVTTILIISLVLMLGCGTGGDKVKEKVKAERPKIGLPMTGLDDEFWIKYIDFTRTAADYFGYELVILDARYSEETQLKNVEDLVSMGVAGIIVLPLTTELAPSLVDVCQKGGVPVVVTGINPERDFPDSDMYLGFINQQDEEGGYETAKALAESGSKKVVGIEGVLGLSFSELRTVGFKRAAEEFGMEILDIQPSDWMRERGTKVMEDFIIAYGEEIDGVWSAGTDPLMGALTAIENAGLKGKISLTGIDHTESGIQALKAGDLYMLGGGHWTMGGYAMVLLSDYLNGLDIEVKGRAVPLSPYVYKEDVDKFIEKIAIPLKAGISLVDWSKVNKTENPDINYDEVFTGITLDNV
jgi:ABC-type sugar transport system substrate-binding protein